MEHLHLIKVEDVKATNRSVAKVRLTSMSSGEVLTIPYTNAPGDMNPAVTTAKEYLFARNYFIVHTSYGHAGTFLIDNAFYCLPPQPETLDTRKVVKVHADEHDEFTCECGGTSDDGFYEVDAYGQETDQSGYTGLWMCSNCNGRFADKDIIRPTSSI